MGIPTLISTATASGASEVDITSGIDSTYDEYMFVVTDIGPATDNADFTFQFNAAGGSGFNETITSTVVYSYNNEADSDTGLGYETGSDQAQGTAYQTFWYDAGNGADESGAGILHLFSPSNTTYIKHWYFRSSFYYVSDYAFSFFGAGYINTTSAIDEISFKMSSGDFDGVIQMYGVA